MTLDAQQVECLARAALTAALTADGLEVARPERDSGIDLLAYTISPLRVVPIQMKAMTATGSSIDKKYGQIDGLVMVYIRNADSLADAEFYAMTHQEASAVFDGGGRSWDHWGRNPRPQVTGAVLLAVLKYRVLPGEWEKTLLGAGAEQWPTDSALPTPSNAVARAQPGRPPGSVDFGA